VLPPAETLCEAGDAEMAKSPTIGAVTTRVTDALCVSVPSVPVIVNGYEPAATAVVVETAIVVVPEVVTVVGVKVALAPVGNPATLNETVPV